MRKALSFLLLLCLLVGLALPVAAEGTVRTTPAFDGEVRHSVTDSNVSGWGLAFCFTLNAKNVTMYNHNINLTNATLEYEGEDCAITRIGAVVTHLPGLGEDDRRMVREEAAGRKQMQDIRVKKLCSSDGDGCTYAVRVVNIPFEREEQVVYARPYVEIQYQGERVTLYGATDATSYARELEKESLILPYYGTDVDGKGRLFVGDVAVLEGVLYLEIQDELDDWMVMTDPNNKSLIYYACYDSEGNELTLDAAGFGQIELPDMSSSHASETVEIPLPEGTAEVRITGAAIMYWSEWE